MNRLYTLLFSLTLLLISEKIVAQSSNFRFVQLLNEKPHDEIATSVENLGKNTLDFLLREKVKVKQVTPNWIYIQASPFQLNAWQKQGSIGQFHFEFSQPFALNDSTRMHHRVNQVHNGMNGLPAAYTGQDVIIGYVDQGLDYTHPDFKDANGHTRVLRYWDHTLPFDANRTPQPYNYGQAWDSTDIANGICTSIEAGSAHGTTVAGVGSGNGLANGKEKGMAPNSKIIIVESNFGLANWTMTIADACDYIFKVADTLGLPAVVNLSLGTYLGSHDGNDAASQLMESLLDAKPGRIIVSAAGNSGNWQKYHVRGNVDQDTSFVWLKNNPSGQLGANTIYFDLWATPSEINQVKYAFGADRPDPSYGFVGRTEFRFANSSLNTPIYDTLYNQAGQQLATIQIYTSVENGAYHMEAYFSKVDSTSYLYRFMTTGNGKYDLWSNRPQLGLNELVTSIPSTSIMPEIIHYHMPDSLQSIVSSWNCSEKVISVANMHNRKSYQTRDGGTYIAAAGTQTGKLSVNSSKGPSRLDVIKPDITAMGDVALSPGPLSILNNTGWWSNVDAGGFHMRNGGTSMASPVVAGIAGLYLEKCGNSTYQHFKNDLIRAATNDNFTGQVPNFAYGHGKADALNTLLHNAEILSNESYCNAPMNLTVSTDGIINSIVWSNSQTTNPITINQPGYYSATVNYNGNCTTLAEVTIAQGQVLPAPIISKNGNVLTASTSPNYQWYKNGVAIYGATNQSYTVNEEGVFTVSTTSSTGCESFSQPISTVGLNEFEKNPISVYPIPAENLVQISGIQPNDSWVIFDSQGRKMNWKEERENESVFFQIKDASSGIYFIQIERNGQYETIKIQRK